MRPPAPTGIYLVALLFLLAAIAYSDLRDRRIPNPLVLLLCAGGALHATLGAGLAGLAAALSGTLVGLAAMIVQYRLGWMGAGDAKLLAALGAWFGPAGVLGLLLLASLFGGLLALVGLARLGPGERARVASNLKGFVLTHQVDAPSPASQRAGVPYGVAIAAAAALLTLGGL